MRKKILGTYLILIVVMLVTTAAAFWGNGYRFINRENEKHYLSEAEILADVFEEVEFETQEDYDSFTRTYANKYKLRITLIQEDGTVLSESSSVLITDNHDDREEVKRAMAGEAVCVKRYSETMGMSYYYCAVPVENGSFQGVLRISVPLKEMKVLDLHFLSSVGLSLLISLGVALILVYIFSHYITRPLEEQNEELRKLESMRSDFVSNVTHELKTPLTSIRGFVETLKAGAIQNPTVAKRFLDIIDIEAERLYNLIQDILSLSEIESKIEYELQECNMNEVVFEVQELLRPKVQEQVSLVFKPQAYVKPYPCNRDRIKQLLINLVDNAIKNTEEGRITISCVGEDQYLVLTVEDTGIGIEEEALPRIFERFYRVDKGRSRKQGGTGLGLSIVKHIVEMYNGNIVVTSEVGKGTKFVVKLPYER